MIRLLIAEDHKMMRDGIRRGLHHAADIQVVGEAADGLELNDRLAELRPDVLLLDVRMPHFDALDAIPQIRARCPGTKILILTGFTERTLMRQLRELGVDGYLAKDETSETVVKAIRIVAGGQLYYSQQMVQVALETKPNEPSPAELRVLTLAARGMTNNALSERLKISPRTAETYVKRACDKLGVGNRTAAIAKAVQLGLIDVLELEECSPTSQ